MAFLSIRELEKQAKQEIDVEMLSSHCAACKAHLQYANSKFEIQGEGRKKILIISDRISELDEYYQNILYDEYGFLSKEFYKHGIELRDDCWRIAAVRCRTDKKDCNTEANHCKGFMQKAVFELKPKLVIIFGSTALKGFFPEFKKSTTDMFRGYLIPDRLYKTNFYITYHPREIIKEGQKYENRELKALIQRDLNDCLSKYTKGYVDFKDESELIQTLTTADDILKELVEINRYKKAIYFDYEATGLKPYIPGHKIASIGIATSANEAFAFPYQYPGMLTTLEFKAIKSEWKKILQNKEIEKYAHNIKFEEVWSKIIVGLRPANMAYDTMLSAHIIDNRRGFTGLKFQSFLHWGVRPYGAHLDEYLKSTSKSKGFNRVMEAPLKELLIYNGLDCLYGWRLKDIQTEYLSKFKGLRAANKFFHSANKQMCTLQLNGITVNEEYYKNQRKELTFKINALIRRLGHGREAKAYERQFGKALNIGSGQQLGKLFYEVLGKHPLYTSAEKINYKTDKETIRKLNLPFGNDLLKVKQLIKVRNTFLAQFAKEAFDGEIHPFFDLNIPVSYRGSSSAPNFQNQPKRDAEIKRIIRSGIYPRRKMHVLGEFDFKGAEVVTSCCYHKDPTFFNYLTEKDSEGNLINDMHRDNAMDLFMLDKNALINPNFTKEQEKRAAVIRFFSKNNWTFAQFYGDWYFSCAAKLWENCILQEKLILPSGQLLEDHLNSQGIYELETFREHCKTVQDKMWNHRFPQYTQWKKDIVKFYQLNGYIETFFGFRFTGLMDSKQCTNYPVQGTSFHLLLVCLIRIQKMINKYKLRTRIIGQIHDSVISDIYLPELEFYLKECNKIVNELFNTFKWLIVPIEMEAEISLPRVMGGNFNNMYTVSPQCINNFDLQQIYKEDVSDRNYSKLLKFMR